MTIEDEMKLEMQRLEKELKNIEGELQKLYSRISELLELKKRKEKDLHVLKSYFRLKKDKQKTLAENIS